MKPIQPIMSEVVARLVRPAPLSAEKVLFAWRMAVGAPLARATLVRLRSDGCLLVQLQDERWRPELERAAGVVRDRMVATLGADVLLDVRIAGSSGPAARRPRRATAGSLGPAPGPRAKARESYVQSSAPPATRKKRRTR